MAQLQHLKIIHVKLINHIVLGDIEFDLNNDVVSIVGKNGSGKSFLMDTLQPYSRSNRFVGTYPFKKGETGFKQIDFMDQNGIIYETKHEFVPKGKTHACKSYLNKVISGVVEELNPTGHCDKYEELVKLYLKFDSSCLDIGFLSFKANGITQSKGVDRKKTLETTIDNAILKSFKKNVKSLVSEHNAMAKQYEKQKVRLASQYTEDSLIDKINELTVEKDRANNELQSLMKKREDVKVKLSELDKLSNVDNKTIKSILSLTSDDMNVYEKYNKYQDAVRRSETLSNEILVEDKKINLYMANKQLKTDIENSKSILEVKESEYNKISANINKYILESDINVISWMESTLMLAKDFTDRLSSIKVMITSEDNLNSIISDLVESKSNMDEFVSKYKIALSNTDGESYNVDYSSNCDSCQLYNKFVKSVDFVKQNSSKWDRVINIERPEVEDKILTLNIVKDNIRRRLLNVISDSSNILTGESLDRVKMNSVDEFLNGCSSGSLYPNLHKLYEWYKDKVGIRDLLQSNISDIKNKMNVDMEKYNMLTSTESIDNTFDINQSKDKIKKIRSELSNYVNIISDSSYKSVGDLNMSDPDIFKYSNMSKAELQTLYNNIESVDKDRDIYVTLHDKCNDRCNELPKNIESYISSIASLNHKLSDLKDVNTKLLDYDTKRKIFQRCKDIIDKDIPIQLLRNNLNFIEKTTNSILSDNGINMSITIIPTESEIGIEVMVKDKIINDAIQLSAGETSIISLILNACILHIIGYPILCLDEADAFMDAINRVKYNDLVSSIRTLLNISQIFVISHNIAGMYLDYSTKICLGDNLDSHKVDIQL